MPASQKILVATVFISPLIFMQDLRPALLIFDALCIFTGFAAFASKKQASQLFKQAMFFPFISLGIFISFQLVPFPGQWLKALSPETWSGYQATIWAAAEGTWMPLSVYPYITLTALLHLLAIGVLNAAFMGAVKSQQDVFVFFRATSNIVSCWAVMSFICSMMLLFGMGHAGGYTDTLVEVRNCLVVFGVIFLPLLWGAYSLNKPHMEGLKRSTFIHIYMKSPQSFPHISYSFASLLVGLAILAGPLPVIAIAMMCGWVLYKTTVVLLKHDSGLFVRGVVCLLAVICMMTPMTVNRLFDGDRLYWDSARVLYPEIHDPWLTTWFGSGVGAHGEVPTLADNQLAGTVKTSQREAAIELWMGLGLVGTIIFLLALYKAYFPARKKFSTQCQRPFYRHIFAGGLASTCVSLSLLGGRSPGNWSGLIFVMFMIATVVASSGLSFTREKGGQRSSTVTAGPWKSTLGIISLSALLLAVITFQGLPILPSGSYFSKFQEKVVLQEGLDGNPFLEKIDVYLKTLPLIDEPYTRLGRELYSRNSMNEARELFQEALKRRPLSAPAVFDYASALAMAGEIVTANKLLGANAMRGYIPDAFSDIAVLRLLDRSPDVLTQRIVRLVLNRAPELTSRYIALMTLAEWDEGLVRSVVPMHPKAWLQYGYYLSSQGDSSAAEAAFDQAVRICAVGSCEDVSAVFEIVEYHLEQGQTDKALKIALLLSQSMPGNERLKKLASELSFSGT